MRRKAGLLLVVVAALLAGYTLRRSPAPVSGGEAPRPTVVIPEPQVVPVAAPTPEPVLLPRPMAEPQPAVPVAPVPVGIPVPVVTPPAGPDTGEQAELRAIDAYAAQERQKIEAWYANEQAGLKAKLEQRMQHLSEVDKLAWAQFYQRANETWSTTCGFGDTSVHDYGYGSAHGYGFYSGTTTTSVIGNPAGDYAAITAQIKDSRQATQEDFTKAQAQLAWLRGDKLAGVQAEVGRRKAMIALRRSRAQTETTRKQAGDLTPKVGAIIGGSGQFRALIGDDLVPEGATVQGYRVQKIRADSVEFEKDGQTWVQKVE